MMAIRYTGSTRAKELLAEENWRKWKGREDNGLHTSSTQCIEPDPYGRCESPSLRLTTYARIGDETRQWKDTKKQDKLKTETDNSRGVEVESVVKCCNKHQMESELVKQFRRIPGAAFFVAQLKSRLIVNQAGGVIENGSICLHPHFGYPYIPGSAVKGCARHAAWLKWLAMEDGDAKKELARKIAVVFGFPTMDKSDDQHEGLDDYIRREFKDKIGETTAFGGSVIFGSAEPMCKNNLEEDILTPHGSGNPIPNVFPVVKCEEDKGLFLFSLAPLERDTPLGPSVGIGFAMECLKEGICENGMGAKTRAGYGWFEVVSSDREEELWKAYDQGLNLRKIDQEKDVSAFCEKVRIQNIDWRTVEVDDSLVEELSQLGQKPFKNLFKESNEKLSDPRHCRALFEICLRGKHATLWGRERGNENGAMCKKMTVWAEKFGETI